MTAEKVELECRRVEEREDIENFPDYVRRTRTLCIHHSARPEIGSKDLAKVTIRNGNQARSGVFCMEARSAQQGLLIGSSAHLTELGVKEGDTVDVSITPATAFDCANWLEKNSDPERKAFGHMLKTTISANKAAHAASENAEKAHTRSLQNLEMARAQEMSAASTKNRAYLFSAGFFILGALLDLGLIEEKFGITITGTHILQAAAASCALIVGTFIFSLLRKP